MNERQLPDFLDPIEWNLVARASYTAPETPTPYLNRLPLRSYLIQNSHALIFGLESQSARSNWDTGAWCYQLIPFLPSSTSNFPAAVQAGGHRLRLRRLNFVMFQRLSDQWVLEVQFPYWLNDVSVEIWRYDGRDIDLFQRSDEIAAAIAAG